MKRFILQTALVATTVFGAFAETAVVDFTYANGDLIAFGKGKKETVDVAMCINDPGLKGMKVIGIKAYLNTTEEISGTSLWLSKELTLENKVNVPDIASYDVLPVVSTYNQYELGELAVSLDQPYVLDGEPLYVGYTLTIDNLVDNGQRYPVVLTDNVVTEGLYIRMSKSVLKWKEYAEIAGGVALIVVELEGDFPANSLGFKECNTMYAPQNEDFTADFTVSNLGGNAVENIEYTYSVDNGLEVTNSVELVEPIEPSLTKNNLLTLNFGPIEGVGKHQVNITLTKVNGQPNESTNSNFTFDINVIPFIPVKRPLVEEYTGLWCGWCTRGYFAMETIKEHYDEMEVSICYHNGDAMTVTNDYPVSVPGFPSASLDRHTAIDPYYGSGNNDFGIIDEMLELANTLATAEIEVEASLEENTVNIESSVRFVEDIDNANYQIGYVLIANGLHNPSWGQQNYFPGYKSQYTGTPLEVLTDWPSVVYDLIFNDVAIDVNGMKGVKESLPTEIKLGETYSHTFSYDIENNKLVQDLNELVVAAFIVDKRNGYIVNSNKCNVFVDDETTAVKGIGENAEVISSEYYDLNGRKVANASNGLFVKIEKLSDGSSRTSKVMLSK